MTTQDHIQIKDIRDDVAILKDGSAIVVMQTSAVNFDLLSENEQLAIIATFAAMLNSLSFPLQIIIRSKRLDISSYLDSLAKTAANQTNPLLKEMTVRYRNFVETIIRENEVLDKQFYLVVSVASLEAGLTGNIEKNFAKAMTILMPRRDHVMRQISRIGLKVTPLNSEKLAKLFYDIYNESDVIALADAQAAAELVSQQKPPEAIVPKNSSQSSQPKADHPLDEAVSPQPAPQPVPLPQPQPQPVPPPVAAPVLPISPPIAPLAVPTAPPPQQFQQNRKPPDIPTPRGNYTSPFVVEELPEDYGRA